MNPNAGTFKKGEKRPGQGRPKGSVTRTTTTLKEAILLAADQVGLDNTGTDGLTGYLRFIAWNEPKAFAGLLGRVLPLQLTGADGGPLQIVFASEDRSL